MTDRPPIRVGPLVLKWATDRKDVTGAELRDAYECPLVAGSMIELYDEVNERGQLFVSHGGTRIMFDRFGPIALCLSAAEKYLTETGYLAQYRSRRRLLARECERRAEHWRSVALDCADRDANYTKAVLAHAGAIAAKYARWAAALRRRHDECPETERNTEHE